MHNESCFDIARLLLKIGVELSTVASQAGHIDMQMGFLEAKKYVLKVSQEPWPYFVLRSGSTSEHLISIFSEVPEVHEYVRSCGFDVYLHLVESDVVLFFSYGHFRAGIALNTRKTDWKLVLQQWKISYVGCPLGFQDETWP